MAETRLLLCNGKVVTLDRASTVAEAVSIADGRILAVGATQTLRRELAPGTVVVDLNGRTVIPGFFDAHPHMDREGLKARGGVPIAGLKSVRDIVGAVAEAVKKAQPGEWVVVMPMGEPPHDYVSDPGQLAENRFPNRHDLDAVSPRNPVYIRSVWGWWSKPPFPSVANSLALQQAGIIRDTPAPYQVEIVKDQQGEPTGVFLERNRAPALEYTLFKRVPRFTYEDRVASARIGCRLYGAVGTTSGYEGHGLTPDIIRAYREVRDAGDLTVRLYTPISVPSAAKRDSELVDLMHHWAAFASERGDGAGPFRVGGITLDLADPTLALVIGEGYPYCQWAGHFHQGLSDDRFVALGVQAVKLGLRLNALVCYGVERALRLFEAIDREAPIRDLRCVGIHLLDATDEQLRRIKGLGLILTMTPSLLYQHAQALGLDRLGEAAVPLRRVLDAGIPVVLSTDNVPYSMLFTMWAALERLESTGRKFGESHLTREEVLRMSVQSGHYLTWDETTRGSIEVGKAADLVVLDADPLTCPVERIPEISVDLTLVDGRIVHQRAGSDLLPAKEDGR